MAYKVIKRAFDVFASVLAIIVLALPWLIIAIIIKLKSPGPAVYKAKRVGKDGKIFTLYKFRTMRVHSEEIHTTTLKSDPRIFPFGAALRKCKLDETLQLINILKGEMSVVGPRPEEQENVEKMYTGKYKDILSVLPGLSSPASIYDYTHGELYENEEVYETEFVPQKLELELYYVEHRSVGYDAKTIVLTVVTIVEILFGKKSFEVPKELITIK